MFRTDLLSIIRSLSTVYTGVGICHASYVDCLLARSGWNGLIQFLLLLFLYWYVCFACLAWTNLTFRGPCIVIYSYNKSQQDALFLKFILINNSTCFGQIYCPSSGVSALYTQQYTAIGFHPDLASTQST